MEGIGPSVPYNKIANWYTGQMLKNTHVPVAYWRSVGGSQNSFYLESFIDELAHAAGKDPLEFRRSLTDRRGFAGRAEQAGGDEQLAQPSCRRDAAAASRWWKSWRDWRPCRGSDGRTTTARSRWTRVFAATDAYHVVNPNLVEAQIEGGVIFGMTAMLYGEITIKDGAALQSNFDNYRMVRLADAPEVEAALALDRRPWTRTAKPKWGGVGECSVGADRRRHRQRDLRRRRASASARCRSKT